MPDLNLDTNYFDHPKTIRLIGLLVRGAEVMPLRIWCYVAKHHPIDGRLAGYSAQEIETIAGWWGERGKAVEALVTVRFLDKIKSGYRVHGWKKRAGHIWAYKLRSRKANAAKYNDIALLKPPPSRSQQGPNKEAPSITQPASPSLHDPPNGRKEHQVGPESGSNGAGSGSGGSGSVGNLGGEMRGELASADRVLELQSLFARVGVNSETQKELYIRRDISPGMVKSLITELQADPTVKSLAGTLVKRLREFNRTRVKS